MLVSEREATSRMWKPINPNPKNKAVGDCAVRAIAVATGKGWEETYLDLCLFGLLTADMPSSNAVSTAYLKSKGFRRRTIPDECPYCYTISDFCKDHPKGTYIIGTGSHLTTVIDGDLWDSWNSENETPVYYWDKNLPTIYIKSVNAQGVPSMRILDFTERTVTSSTMPATPHFNCNDNFVTLDSFNALKGDVEALRGKLEELNAKPVQKSKNTEVETDG